MVSGRRQLSCDGTSRMTRECHVRICERLGVRFPGPTRQKPPFQLRPSKSGLSPKADVRGAEQSGFHRAAVLPPPNGSQWVRAPSLLANTNSIHHPCRTDNPDGQGAAYHPGEFDQLRERVGIN